MFEAFWQKSIFVGKSLFEEVDTMTFIYIIYPTHWPIKPLITLWAEKLRATFILESFDEESFSWRVASKKWQQQYPDGRCFLFPHLQNPWCWSVWVPRATEDEQEYAPLSLAFFDKKGSYEKDLFSAHTISLQHPLLKMIKKIKKKRVLSEIWEGMGGRGQDTLFLLHLGHPIRVWEQNPILAFLWTSAMEGLEELYGKTFVQERLFFQYGNFWQAVTNEKKKIDGRVIYLDPFFEEGEKKRKGLPPGEIMVMKKLQQLFHAQMGPTDQLDQEKFSLLATHIHPISLIVKRPLKGVGMTGVVPQGSVKGKSLAWDIYAFTFFSSFSQED
jgi:hypothetical protein